MDRQVSLLLPPIHRLSSRSGADLLHTGTASAFRSGCSTPSRIAHGAGTCRWSAHARRFTLISPHPVARDGDLRGSRSRSPPDRSGRSPTNRPGSRRQQSKSLQQPATGVVVPHAPVVRRSAFGADRVTRRAAVGPARRAPVVRRTPPPAGRTPASADSLPSHSPAAPARARSNRRQPCRSPARP